MLDARSEQVLAGVAPRLQFKARQLESELQAMGIPIQFRDGYRSDAEQNAIPSSNTNAKAGQSYHNFGLAVDCYVGLRDGLGKKFLVPYTPDLWGVTTEAQADYLRMGEAGEKLGLRWGGRWPKPDRPHFQLTVGLPDTPTDEMRALLQQRDGLMRVWLKYGGLVLPESAAAVEAALKLKDEG
jgi:peptidoglycan L-alanyl-D-glutamate endopeptidase CwlK